jgi:signal recognition particle subunit SRP54
MGGAGKRGPLAGLANMMGFGGGMPSATDMAKLAEKMPGGVPGAPGAPTLPPSMPGLPPRFPGAPGGLPGLGGKPGGPPGLGGFPGLGKKK